MTPIWQPEDDLSAASPNNQLPDSTVIQKHQLNWRALVAAFIILLALATIILIPIFWRGFPAGIDSDRHFRWVMQFSESVREPGVFYPRWLASANNHQGSPVTLYYPPLSFYAVAFFSLFADDMQKALMLSCWLALFLSGVTMFAFAKSLFSANLSLLAASVYMLAPYHLFDLYQGSSLAEFWSFVFVPLVFHASYRITKTQTRKAIAYLALSYAFLLFTHIPISFVVTLVLPIYVLFLTRNLKQLLQIATGLILGAGMSAIFLASVAFEREFVQINAILRQDYTRYFLFKHAKRALTTALFSQSSSDFETYTDSMKGSDFQFLIYTEQIGLAMLLLFLILAVVFFLSNNHFDKLSLHRPLLYALGTITAISLVMTSRFSSFIWQTLEQFRYLQFPSRWFVITTAGLALLTVNAFSRLPSNKNPRLAYGFLLVLALAINLFVSAFAIARAPHDAQAFDPALLRREAAEYRPIWWDKELHEAEQLPPFTIASGRAELQVIDSDGLHQTYGVKASEEATIHFRTLFFPGWVARLDGQEKSITPSPEGRIQIQIEPGEHQLTLNFEDTRPRLVGKIISAISLLCVMALAFIPRRQKKPA
jgi:hypothetical protein